MSGFLWECLYVQGDLYGCVLYGVIFLCMFIYKYFGLFVCVWSVFTEEVREELSSQIG